MTRMTVSPAAVELGRLGGKKGGNRTVQRSEIARKAAQARWLADFTAEIPIRYDGLLKRNLFALGELCRGLQGISVVGNFVAYAKQFQAHEVRVVAAEAKSGC